MGVAGAVLLFGLLGCHDAPGKPKPGPEVPRPEQVQAFGVLYQQNCAACHGDNGVRGAAIALANPAYLAVAGEANLVKVTTNGVPGTLMPPFGKSAGGMLTDEQIHSLVKGMIDHWGGGGVSGVTLPGFAATTPGDSTHGAQVFATYCARCHGADGAGQPRPAGGGAGAGLGSIVDPTYLSLISDGGLRALVIGGMPDQGMPDWRGDVAGRAMSDAEITDVVAWLGSHRPQKTGSPHAAGKTTGE
jgi:cytochrome c oxidase cbb3-type subunit 3/ubiquinol-cytochrome c reductase cytochrome c subunit